MRYRIWIKCRHRAFQYGKKKTDFFFSYFFKIHIHDKKVAEALCIQIMIFYIIIYYIYRNFV